MSALLILASAFLHAFWNARLKRQPEIGVAGSVVFLVTGLTAVASALVAWFVSGDAPFANGIGIGWTIAAGACEAGYFTLLVLAFRLAPMGTVYAVSRGFAILAAWPVSVLWLGETVSVPTALGAALVVAGLLFSTVRIQASLKAVLIALASGAFIAGYHLFYKQAISLGAAPTAVFALSLAIAVPVNIALLERSRRERLLPLWRERFWRLTGLGVICAGSFLLILLAFEFAGAGYVLTLRNASILFALLLAWRMGERPGARQWAGGAMIAAGAAMLGLAGG